VLVEFQHLLPDHGVALDLAAGLGGNALLLAWYGLATHAWDISPVAMERLRGFAAERGLSVPFGSLTKALRPTGLPPDTPLRRSSPWT
jgi:hypothetical protein